MNKALLAGLLLTASLTGCASHPESVDLVRIPSLPAPPPPPPTSSTARVSQTALPLARSPEARDGRPKGRELDSHIAVEWHGKYYPATVMGTTPEGLTRIHYDGYGAEWDEDVGEDRIREPDDFGP